MSKDYKPAPPKAEQKPNPFLNGLIVGLLIGVGIAVAFTVYLKGGESPFSTKNGPAMIPESGNPVETGKEAKVDEAPPKDRFEYYNILPGNEAKVTEQEIKQLESNAQAKETYFLQVGAFKTEQEADNVKAKLALLGLEAIIQTATSPEKGVLHRVRVGPFSDPSQLTKTRGDLVENGFKPDLIKVNTTSPQ
ncbi:SPOR domain-containing protein [Candidatus Methylopumilus turicensis]|jgi:cell division protein FtsN|uniref:Sporulation domain protein n=1 Tax=Candidatus Methylopumilus turicensis TaxID=1581680 RepID=A0A0B7J211_9PROT|nr:SPOR domain-containing protein [Candidatus Methylopumilus turicensis]CEN56793.1 Sporulation domain protein [Candidatus Methylopumilus turicensis]